ncbi:MAG TPA: hypothetical protein VHM69_07875 [Rubrobacter sp.]|nr:hypothetical protein [Rubrobacter sp.]
MAAAQVTAGGAYALSLAFVVAILYLALVRFMDLNEKEPLWAVGLMFLLGAVTAAVLPLLVGYAVLELNPLLGAVSEEVAKFVAFFIGVVVLATLWTTALVGLSDGLFGVIIGAGFGAAAGARPMESGLISQQQYDALGSVVGRMGSTFRTLRSGGFGGWRANARFSQAATELAFHRDRVQRGVTSVDAASRESAYVQTLRELRART